MKKTISLGVLLFVVTFAMLLAVVSIIENAAKQIDDNGGLKAVVGRIWEGNKK